MTGKNSRKEYCRRRYRRVSALLAALALLFTMVPAELYTTALAAETKQAVESPLPEETVSPVEENPTGGDTEADTETDGDTAEAEADSQAATDGTAAIAAKVQCYAALNGGWHLVATTTVTRKDSGSNGRYYITVEELEKIYGVYGFTAADFAGERYFPHTDGYDSGHIWGDAPPVAAEGSYLIPLSFRTESHLYYMPANHAGSASYFESNVKKTDEAVLADNMFYSVTVQDAVHAIYPTDELPQTQYLFHGTTAEITLKAVEGIRWDAVNSETGDFLTLESVTDGDTVTFTIRDASQPITFHPHISNIIVEYETALGDRKVKIGQFEPSSQTVVQDATTRGEGTLALLQPDGESHTVLEPDIDRVKVKLDVDNNRYFFYTFQGWQVVSPNVDDANALLQPGAILTEEQLQRYAGEENTVLLRAVWSGTDIYNRPNTLHYFLHVNGEIRDSIEDGSMEALQSDYTASIYTSRLLGADRVPNGTVLLVARRTENDSAYAVDSTIRNMITTPVQGATIEDMPSDEEVFEFIRANKVEMKVDGVTVPIEMLNSDHFQIRWNTLKYERSDGWHIDGILVAKRARFAVSKTFVGDTGAIAGIKEDFSIGVYHTEESGEVQDFTLRLLPAEEVTAQNELGYVSYNEESDTYLWEVPARQGREYTLREQNYLLEDTDTWRETNRYIIHNRPDGTAAEGYSDYPAEGIHLTATSYAGDVPITALQTAAIQNMYVGAGTLTVKKQDAVTGNGLSGVGFTLYDAGNEPMTLYRKAGAHLYSTGVEEDYTEKITNGKVTTGANGFFTVKLAEGEYYLAEALPAGYYGATRIKVTVTAEGTAMYYHSEVLEASTEVEAPEGGWLRGAETAEITVLNSPWRLIHVIARKSWDSAVEQKKPVTVELWRDGAPLTPAASYTQVLSEENGWEYSWSDLPLFTDGKPADYTLREIRIGDVYRDPNVAEDGFADYIVTYEDPQYSTDGETFRPEYYEIDENGVQKYATEALLTVHNEDVHGEIAVEKVDERGRPLAGAEFTLYADADCATALETTVSDADGVVRFATKRPAGTYYLRETAPPKGYTAAAGTWTVTVKAGKATVYNSAGTAVTRISNESRLRLKIRVIGTDGLPVPGATLRLAYNGISSGSYRTDEDGLTAAVRLSAGDHRTVMGITPAGYYPWENAVTLQAIGGTLSVIGGTADGTWALTAPEEGDTTYTLTVRLEIQQVLPTTGGRGTAPFTMAGAALLAAAAMVLYRKRRTC